MIKCPVCGYQENVSTVLQHSVMSVYVDDATGKVDSVHNSKEDYITVKGRKLRRQDLKVESSIDPKPAIETKPTPKPIVKPVEVKKA